jgi:hypothetical protein
MTNLAATSSPLNRNWNKQLIKLRDNFPILTEKDVHYADGKKEEMLNCIQLKLGKSKVELENIIASL